MAIIFLGTSGLLKDIPVNRVHDFELAFLTTLEHRFPQVLENFKAGKLDKEDTDQLRSLASELAGTFKK